ncbi:MAG: murein biosynthesis integral membrane protein MurJ [Gammaproteobacteria bacterium]|nr:murein biosynthesis integral membrane protein MurJ [Gammaproteobacteria bacterium]MDH5803077.1 murein biosynthesis integral membrane protein MurJ [Gammaproteobacteria bacterium]
MSRKLFKSTAIVSGNTFLSRISGLVRDVVFARYFGADGLTDAFFIAFKIPNFLRRLFAEGAFSQAFVPVLSEYKTTKEHEEVRELARNVTGTLGLILFVITLIGVIAAPILVMVFATGYMDDAPRQEITATMLRITFPYILFISLTALAGGVLNSYGKFGIPAFTPVLLNLCMIAAAIWLSPHMEQPIVALAWGVFAAGALQLAFQIPFIWQLKLLAWPKWGWRDSGVKKIIDLMIPALFGSSVQQLNLLFDVWIATFLAAGSISWLYYADRLVEFPFGVFGVAVATVILPSLSAKHAGADADKFNRTLDWAMRWVMVIGTPAAVGLIALSGPMIITIFHYGEFKGHDMHMTQLALMAYSVGLLGFIYVKVLSPGYFARQDTKTPVKIAIKSVGVKMLFTVLLVGGMLVWAYEAPHVGLAAATAISAIFNSLMLLRGLRRDGVYKAQSGWGLLILRVLVACVLMTASMYLAFADMSPWLEASVYERVLRLGMWVGIGGAVYFSTLYILGMNFKALLKHG